MILSREDQVQSIRYSVRLNLLTERLEGQLEINSNKLFSTPSGMLSPKQISTLVKTLQLPNFTLNNNGESKTT
jgi:hypothetical protein